MTELFWIVAGGLLMSAIALSGSVSYLVGEARLVRWLLPLVAFAAGSLVGGALFHMLPAALARAPARTVFGWLAVGFTVFLALEQLLHAHHCQRAEAPCRRPLTYLILIGDALHNLLGGLAVAGLFLVDVQLGIAAWIAAAAHEVPQEIGDFAVLVHGGWSRRAALLFNLLSGLTFLAGGVVAYCSSLVVDLGFLVPFAAGNFLYIGAVDLVPEVNRPRHLQATGVHLAAFSAGLMLLYACSRA